MLYLFGCRGNYLNDYIISARPFDARPRATTRELSDARSVCYSGNGVIDRVGSPVELAGYLVHLRNSGAVDTRVHRTILRRHDKIVAGGIFFHPENILRSRSP